MKTENPFVSPQSYGDDQNHPNSGGVSGGMTLRDYFAAKAIMLFSLSDQNIKTLGEGGRPSHELVARFCYDLADAMLAERSKQP